MNEPADQLAKSLLQKNSVADCDIHELQQLAERYPYSAIHQVLLLHKIKNANAPDHGEQFGKTGLYFQQPLWLDQLLHAKGEAVVIEKHAETVYSEPVITAPLADEATETSLTDIPTLNIEIADEPEEVKEETIAESVQEEEFSTNTTDEETVHVPAPDPVIPEEIQQEAIAEQTEEEILRFAQDDKSPDTVVPEEVKEETIQHIEQEEPVSNMDNAMKYAETIEEVTLEQEVFEEDLHEPPPPPGWKPGDVKEEPVSEQVQQEEQETGEPGIVTETFIEEIEEEEPEPPPPPGWITQDPEQVFKAIMENPQTEEPVVSNHHMTEENTKERGLIQDESIQAEETDMKIPSLTIEPIDPATAELSFQPYHTVDYFASQGIKFKEEERPKDRFGQQLKSFTEWLKVLKKAPVSEVAGNVSKTLERKVEQMAEHSIEEGGEVLTEAMAEVWEKQGNRQKASEIYRKLSLLNPSKSSYFAAKIEQLKNN